jgi:hypothetical protein
MNALRNHIDETLPSSVGGTEESGPGRGGAVESALVGRQPWLRRVALPMLLLPILLALPGAAPGEIYKSIPLNISGGNEALFLRALSPPLDGVTWDLGISINQPGPNNGLLQATAVVNGLLGLILLDPNQSQSVAVRLEYKKMTFGGTLEVVHTTEKVHSYKPSVYQPYDVSTYVSDSYADRDLVAVTITTYDVSQISTRGGTAQALIHPHSVTFYSDSQWDFHPKINNGSADFGSGNHSNGGPEGRGSVSFFRSLPNTTLSPATPLGDMLAVVKGTLYWDALFGGGTARLRIVFEDASGKVLDIRERDVTGPGFNANDPKNKRTINESFSDPTLFKVLLLTGTVSNGNFENESMIFTMEIGNSPDAGTFELQPRTAETAVRDRLNYAFTWTVPEPHNWHDLESLALRIRDGNETVFSLLFDEASNTFSHVDPHSGKVTRSVAPGPGSDARFESDDVTLYLRDSSVVGSGPTGPSVTLNLSLEFKPHAEGKTFVVEAAGTDDFGNEDTFSPAGSVGVTPRKDKPDTTH